MIMIESDAMSAVHLTDPAFANLNMAGTVYQNVIPHAIFESRIALTMAGQVQPLQIVPLIFLFWCRRMMEYHAFPVCTNRNRDDLRQRACHNSQYFSHIYYHPVILNDVESGTNTADFVAL